MLFADRYQLTLASHCGLANLTGRNSALLDQQACLYAPVMTDMPTRVAAPSLRVDLVTAVRTSPSRALALGKRCPRYLQPKDIHFYQRQSNEHTQRGSFSRILTLPCPSPEHTPSRDVRVQPCRARSPSVCVLASPAFGAVLRGTSAAVVASPSPATGRSSSPLDAQTAVTGPP